MLTEYNGFTFPSDTHTVYFNLTPRYDSSGRTVTDCLFDFQLHWSVTSQSAAGLNIALSEIVEKLEAPAGVLKYQDRGLEKNVNTEGVKDVEYGPRPGDLSFAWHGGMTATCDWKCQFNIPVCNDAVFDGVREWCFSVAYGIDRLRNTTITTKGHVIVAGNRRSPKSRLIAVTADDFLESVSPPLRLGFRRETDTHELSENKLRLDYTAVDVSLGINSPGKGLIDAQAVESATSEDVLATYIRTLEATYTVAPGFPVNVAWEKFVETVNERVLLTKRQIPAVAIRPVSFSCSDPEVYGQNRKVQMRLSWRVSACSLAQALGKTGIWVPVPKSSAREWQDFISADPLKAFGPRGSAGIHWRINEDKIVDLCQPTGQGAISQGSGGSGKAGGFIASLEDSIITGDILNVSQSISGVFPKPEPRNSWEHYEMVAHISNATGKIVGNTLPELPLSSIPTGATWNASNGVPPDGSDGRIQDSKVRKGQSQNSQFPTDTFVQQRTTPLIHVWLQGRAIRYGFSIPEPQLVSVGGKNAILVNDGDPSEGFTMGIVGAKEYPLVGARWNLHYIVPGLESMDVLPNQILAGTANLQGGVL